MEPSPAAQRLGGTRRPEDLESVFLSDRDQPRHVRVTVERRRQNALGGRLTDLPQEPFELHRREADQRPRSARLGVERV